MSKFKVLSIDTNDYYLTNSKPKILIEMIKYFNLVEGELVIVYQDEDQWLGKIERDLNVPETEQWYIDLEKSKHSTVNEAVMTARSESWFDGYYTGQFSAKKDIAIKLFKNGLSIEQVKGYTDISLCVLKELYKNMIEIKDK